MNTFNRLKTEMQDHSSTWLVTGVAGFIGSHLAEFLLKNNQKVIGLDNFATGYQSNVDLVSSIAPKNFQFLEASVADPNACKEALNKIDYVLHQAAIGSVPGSVQKPMESHIANVDGFITLLNEARKQSVKKFVYASSSAVYGDNMDLPKLEDQIGSPLSPYAANKRIDEIYALTFERSYNIPTTGLRYFNVYGPRQDPKGEYAAVIPIWINTMKQEQPAIINGDGSYTRDFCYIDNVVQANLLAATTKTDIHKNIFNIAYGQQTTLLQLEAAIRKAIESSCPGISIPKTEHRDFRQGDIAHSVANISKAQSLLGYEAQMDLETGLKATVDYFLKA